MAIRFPASSATDRNQTYTIRSGWRIGQADTSVLLNNALASLQRFQPSALSRPGNLGTAYTGVWKGW